MQETRRPASRWYYTLALCAPLLYALHLVTNRVALLGSTTPLMLAFSSSFFATLCACGALAWPGQWQALRQLNRRSWGHLIVLSVVMGIIARLVLMYGQALTTTTNTGFLLRTSPIFTIVLAYFLLQETLMLWQIGVMACMLVGVFLLATGGSFVFHTGDLLVLLNGAFVGFDVAWSKKALVLGSTSTAITLVRFLVGTLGLMLMLLNTTGLSWAGWETGLLSGVFIFATLLARTLASTHLKAGLVGSLMLLTPVFTAVIGLTWLQEQMTAAQACGGGLIALSGCGLLRAEERQGQPRAMGKAMAR